MDGGAAITDVREARRTSWLVTRSVEVMPISEITRRAIIDELSLSKI
jgi:hypothetical protein